MNSHTLLWRQIHPNFVREGEVSTQAFRPSNGKDLMSFHDGDQISAEAAWRRHTNDYGLQSIGVLSATVQECEGEYVDVNLDGNPDPEHVSVSFERKSKGERKTISKHLRDFALTRGWQVGPEEIGG